MSIIDTAEKGVVKVVSISDALSSKTAISLLLASVIIHGVIFSVAAWWFTSMISSEIKFNRAMLERVVSAIEKLNSVQ